MVHPSHLAVIHAGHVPLVHASHAAVIHSAHAAVVHAHIAHGDDRAWIYLRYGRLQAFTNCQGASGVPGTVHGLREDRIGLLVFGFDDDIVGFGNGDPELIDRYGFDVLAVGSHNRHLEPRNPDIEIGHGRAVDKAQADLLAGLEDTRPVAVRSLAVHEVGVGIPAHISEVGGAHLHFSPHLPIRYSGRPAFLAHIVNEVANCALMEVVVVRLLLEFGEHPRRVFIRPIAEHDDIITVVHKRLRILGINHQRPIDPGLFLEA
ncbi:hypothetical protein D3C76_987750 [compost metagenome]